MTSGRQAARIAIAMAMAFSAGRWPAAQSPAPCHHGRHQRERRRRRDRPSDRERDRHADQADGRTAFVPDPAVDATRRDGSSSKTCRPAKATRSGATRHGYLPADYGRSALGGAPAADLVAGATVDRRRPDHDVARRARSPARCSTSTGNRLSGIYVRALASVIVAGAPHYAAASPTTTDDRGMYRISGLREGRYLVSVPVVQQRGP